MKKAADIPTPIEIINDDGTRTALGVTQDIKLVKDGDEEIFFKALAPYVETGSYLCFKGEDGDTWKWSFSDGSVTYI